MTDPYRNKRLPRLTVDAWIRDRRGRLLLVRRGRPPFKGRWCLPGGFCEWKETTEACCAREAREETGLRVRVGELLGVYSRPDRDPRGHNVTVLYTAKPVGGRVKGGDDAAEARWFTPKELRHLDFAFDHCEIVTEQLARRARRPRARPSRRERRAASPRSASRAQRRT
jgi:8-oxo-dGTP diphosphatase